jgi:hypothetical protein
MLTRDKRISADYLAGIFDGEGSVHCHCKLKARRKGKIDSFTGSVHCFITNTNLLLLEIISNNFGGHIRKMTPQPGRKQGYRIEWHGAKADDLMKLMLATDQLIVKEGVVKLGILFRETKPGEGKGTGRTPYSEEIKDQLHRIAQEIKHLNLRGVLAVAETKPESTVTS